MTTIHRADGAVTQASDVPDKANIDQVVAALNTLATAADKSVGNGAVAAGGNYMGMTFAWMQKRFEDFKLPVPKSLGDGFRILTGIIANPQTLRNDPAAAYDKAAIITSAFQEAVNDSVNEAVRDVDMDVRAAHYAAEQAAIAAQNKKATVVSKEAAPQIEAAAGAQKAVAHADITRLNQSLAAHPNQASSSVRLGRTLWEMIEGFLEVVVFSILLSGFIFLKTKAKRGPRAAVVRRPSQKARSAPFGTLIPNRTFA